MRPICLRTICLRFISFETVIRKQIFISKMCNSENSLLKDIVCPILCHCTRIHVFQDIQLMFNSYIKRNKLRKLNCSSNVTQTLSYYEIVAQEQDAFLEQTRNCERTRLSEELLQAFQVSLIPDGVFAVLCKRQCDNFKEANIICSLFVSF